MVTEDEDSSSSSGEEDEGTSVSDMKIQMQEKPTDKVATAKETEAVAEISALVNYVQPVHFTSFEISESKSLFVKNIYFSPYIILC